MRANHKETKIIFNGTELKLLAGQFITGRFEGSKDCNMKPTTFRDQLKKLNKMGMIEMKSDNKKSVITILKWNDFQNEKIEKLEKPATTSATRKNARSQASIEDSQSFKFESASTSDINPPPTRHRQKCKNEIISVHPLQKFVKENYPRISKLESQLTEKECNSLLEKYSKEDVKSVLEEMENFKALNKKYVSVYRTLNNWLKLRNERQNKFPNNSQHQEQRTISLINRVD
jgi:DNA-binding MarR family transcriptional regulator